MSYASEDRTRARQLMEALESDGASCFIDYRDIEPGHPRYRDRLIEGIGDCEFIVVLVSDCAQASDEVFREVQAAHDRGRRRIAVWLGERSPYTNGTLELLLGSGQDVVWASESAADLASRIRATATVSVLREALTGYESVVNRLEVDLSSVMLQSTDRTSTARLHMFGRFRSRYCANCGPTTGCRRRRLMTCSS